MEESKVDFKILTFIHPYMTQFSTHRDDKKEDYSLNQFLLSTYYVTGGV